MKPVVLGVIVLSAIMVLAGCERNLAGKAMQVVSDGEGGGSSLGYLFLATYPPGATVAVDGVPQGRTGNAPLRLEVFAGTRTVRLEMPQYTAQEFTVDVPEWESVTRIVTMPATACVDTDGGVSEFLYGETRRGASFSRDYCASDGRTIYEAACSGTATKACPNGCGGRVCKPSQGAVTCADTDFGQDFNRLGWTYVGPAPERYPGAVSSGDYCEGSTLTEYYCQGNTLQSTTYACPNGCNAGRCGPPDAACTDSDGGMNPFVRGTASGSTTSRTDSCGNGNGVWMVCEASCYPGEAIGCYDVICPSNQCQNGACVR